ncbi:MAG TPA: trigger factor [Gammaproteobacteria bacterium]|nr:trigger factor [Gammaproteobacteria bacterium]
MQVTVEVLPGLERKVVVKVPGSGVQSEIEKRLKDLAPKVKIDGFRPGKVPFNIVRQRFEDSVRREVVSEVIGSSYQEAIQQEKLTPAGLPKIDLATVIPGQALEFEATFEIYPTIALKELQDVEIETVKVNIDENDVDQMLEKLRNQQAEWVETTEPAEKGNRVLIDFESTLDGKSFEGGTGKDVTVQLGTGAAIPDFENALLGTAAGQENITFTIQFPVNYHRKDLAGKSSAVTAKVHKVLVAKLPEVDEEFAKKLGVADGNIEQLRKEIRDNLQRELDYNVKNQLKGQVLTKLLELNPVELPKVLVNEEIKNLQKQEREAGKHHAHDHDHDHECDHDHDHDHDHEHSEDHAHSENKTQFEQMAKQRVGLGLLFGEIIRNHQLKVDSAQVQARLEQIAAPYKDPQQVVAWYRNNKEQMAQIEASVIEDQIVDILTKQVKLKETVKTYRELVGQQQAAGNANL